MNSRSEYVNQKNFIQWDVRNLFPVIDEIHSIETVMEKVQHQQYLDKTEDVYRLNLVSEKGIFNDLNQILKLDNENLRGIGWACLGGIHTFNGNYKKAFMSFNMALDLPVTNDIKAYIFTELSNLLRKLGYFRECISILKQAQSLAENEKMLWRIKTYTGLCYRTDDPPYSLNLLKKSMHHYEKTREYYRLVNVLRHVAGIYLSRKDFTTAENYQNQATEIIVEKSVLIYEMDIMNDKGWLLIAKKEYDNARELFIKLMQNDLSPYLQSLALQNLGYLEFECKNYRAATNYHSQSLQIANRYEMRDMAFEDYYKLGLSHEKLGEVGLAEHFYYEGYTSLRSELDLGIRISGFRRRLLEAYIHFLSNNQRVPTIDPLKESLSFTDGKTMKQIREVFHKGLLTIHIQQTKNANELCNRLKINPRTFFLHQKKLELRRGVYDESQFENPHFKQYVESLTPFTWKETNLQFEEDLFRYLLSKYQHNKKKIAQVLQVSYQHVVQKTGKLI
ncbi:MAG: hypothetical protein V3U16_04240 [Candidatus Neomarinimicrobiota bacterium]